MGKITWSIAPTIRLHIERGEDMCDMLGSFLDEKKISYTHTGTPVDRTYCIYSSDFNMIADFMLQKDN